jgi:hypothetical protein
MTVKLFDYTGVVKFSTSLRIESVKDNISRAVKDVVENDSKIIFEKSYLRGEVNGSDVMLYRLRPLAATTLLRPVFFGKFFQQNGVILEGVFSMSGFAKFVLTSLLSALALFEVFFLVVSFTSEGPIAAKLGFLAFFPIVGALIIGAHMSIKSALYGDVDWISKAIENVLQK